MTSSHAGLLSITHVLCSAWVRRTGAVCMHFQARSGQRCSLCRSDLFGDTVMIESREADLRSDGGSSEGTPKRLCRSGTVRVRPFSSWCVLRMLHGVLRAESSSGPGCGRRRRAERGTLHSPESGLGRRTECGCVFWICVIEIKFGGEANHICACPRRGDGEAGRREGGQTTGVGSAATAGTGRSSGGRGRRGEIGFGDRACRAICDFDRASVCGRC